MKHGKRGTYVNRGCRCPRCKRANSDYFRRRRKAKKNTTASKVVA